MAAKKDFSQHALSIVEQVTGDGPLIEKPFAPPAEPNGSPHPKNSAAVALGKLGGLKGGKARAAKLTSEKRVEIARNAALKRWSK